MTTLTKDELFKLFRMCMGYKALLGIINYKPISQEEKNYYRDLTEKLGKLYDEKPNDETAVQY